ncbi:MAG: hypothetical protein QHJ73_13805, partial [Armatimonadota bacterium]|nr:hypothetical protein [Armatimonadota bacterium]
EREEQIRKNYEQAEEALRNAEEKRQEYEARLAQAESEARNRIQEGIREGQAIRRQLTQRGEEERDRIIQQGYRDLANEREKMVYSVRESVIDMTLEAASRILKRSLDEPAHRALVQEFLAALPSEPQNESRS